MRIESILTDGGPFSSPLVLADDCGQASNWITVLIGPNGSCKSLLLRLLCEAALGRGEYRGRGHPRIAMSLGKQLEIGVTKVIAVAGTPIDRFPRQGTRSLHAGAETVSQTVPYVYLGMRAANGVAGPLQGERNLARAFLTYVGDLHSKAAPLKRVFGHLDLGVAIGFRLRRPRSLNLKALGPPQFSEANFDQHLATLPGRLESFLRDSLIPVQWKDTLSAFALFVKNDKSFRDDLKAAVGSLHQSDIAFWLTPEVHTVHLKALSVRDWRCAIDLGLAEIDGLCLSGTSATSFPKLAKGCIQGSDLSSGQWNWLSSLACLTLELCDSALVLIDEPENSLHPEWQRDYLGVLSDVLGFSTGCHAFIATHSGFLASGLSDRIGNITALRLSERDGSSGIRTIFQDPVANRYGWAATDVYQDMFGLDSTRAPEFMERANYTLELLRGGIEKNREKLTKLAALLSHEAQSLPAHDVMRQVLQSIADDVSDSDEWS